MRLTEEEESSADDEPEISEDEALSLAEEYYGEDAEYTFEDIITVGDYEYYNFAVDGEGRFLHERSCTPWMEKMCWAASRTTTAAGPSISNTE